MPGWSPVACSRRYGNCLTGKRPDADILDYDLFYFDDRDLSYEAEDAVIHRAAGLFADLGVEVQVRNQARVHLWYAQKFGIPCPPLRSSRDAIDHFLVEPSCLGLRQQAGTIEVYAPFGFTDLFSMTVRPNCRRNTAGGLLCEDPTLDRGVAGLEIIAMAKVVKSPDCGNSPKNLLVQALVDRHRDFQPYGVLAAGQR